MKILVGATILSLLGAGAVMLFTGGTYDIRLNKTELTVTLGNSEQLNAAADTEKTVSWYSDNVNVAFVDANGLVTAMGLGETDIYACIGRSKAVCRVTVDDGRAVTEAGAEAEEATAENVDLTPPEQKEFNTEGAVLVAEGNGTEIIFYGDGKYAYTGGFTYMEVAKFVVNGTDTYSVKDNKLILDNTGLLHVEGPQNFSFDVPTCSTAVESGNELIVTIIGIHPDDGPKAMGAVHISKEDAAKLGINIDGSAPVVSEEEKGSSGAGGPVTPQVQSSEVLVKKTNAAGQTLVVYANGVYTAEGSISINGKDYGTLDITLDFGYAVTDKYDLDGDKLNPLNEGIVNVSSDVIGNFDMTPVSSSEASDGGTALTVTATGDSGTFELGEFELTADEMNTINAKFKPEDVVISSSGTSGSSDPIQTIISIIDMMLSWLPAELRPTTWLNAIMSMF